MIQKLSAAKEKKNYDSDSVTCLSNIIMDQNEINYEVHEYLYPHFYTCKELWEEMDIS